MKIKWGQPRKVPRTWASVSVQRLLTAPLFSAPKWIFLWYHYLPAGSWYTQEEYLQSTCSMDLTGRKMTAPKKEKWRPFPLFSPNEILKLKGGTAITHRKSGRASSQTTILSSTGLSFKAQIDFQKEMKWLGSQNHLSLKLDIMILSSSILFCYLIPLKTEEGKTSSRTHSNLDEPQLDSLRILFPPILPTAHTL